MTAAQKQRKSFVESSDFIESLQKVYWDSGRIVNLWYNIRDGKEYAVIEIYHGSRQSQYIKVDITYLCISSIREEIYLELDYRYLKISMSQLMEELYEQNQIM